MRLDANRAPVLSKLVLLLVLACAQCVAADAPLPAEASFLRGLMELPSKYEVWNETAFPLRRKLHSGKHWGIEGSISGASDSAAAWSCVSQFGRVVPGTDPMAGRRSVQLIMWRPCEKR
jgi:hypothetical protein